MFITANSSADEENIDDLGKVSKKKSRKKSGDLPVMLAPCPSKSSSFIGSVGNAQMIDWVAGEHLPGK